MSKLTAEIYIEDIAGPVRISIDMPERYRNHDNTIKLVTDFIEKLEERIRYQRKESASTLLDDAAS